MSLTEYKMAGCLSDIVVQIPKYNQAQNRPGMETISSKVWERKGKKNSERTFFVMAQDSLKLFTLQSA